MNVLSNMCFPDLQLRCLDVCGCTFTRNRQIQFAIIRQLKLDQADHFVLYLDKVFFLHLQGRD